MIEILDQNERLTLAIDKIQNEWWVELIHRDTGMTGVYTSTTKAGAKAMFMGMTLEEVEAFYNRTGVEFHKVYKKGMM